MAESGPSGGTDLVVPVDADTLTALRAAASERGLEPQELVARWVRERLAHERERGLGRERRQRPADA